MTAQDHRLGIYAVEADLQEGGSVGARKWTERTMEFGQHAIALVLTLISCIRAVSVGAPLVAAIAVSVVFLAWYALGAARAARSGALVLAKWWLIVLAAAWLERARPGEESGDPAARETAGSAASGGFQGSADPAEEGRAARGEWHWRMALASMYCGDPEEAL